MSREGRNRRGSKTAKYLKFLIVSAVILGIVGLWLSNFGFEGMWKGAAKPILRMVAFISIGLFVGQVLESTGYSAKIGKTIHPLIRFARLPHQSAMAFAAAFVSGVTANSLLYTNWKEGNIDRKELILSNLLNASLPSYSASFADDAVHPCAACRLGGIGLPGTDAFGRGAPVRRDGGAVPLDAAETGGIFRETVGRRRKKGGTRGRRSGRSSEAGFCASSS